MPFNVGPLELVIVLVIALLVIGPKRLPEMGNSLGKTMREFRKASSEMSTATSLEPEDRPVSQPVAVSSVAAPTAPTDASLQSAADPTTPQPRLESRPRTDA